MLSSYERREDFLEVARKNVEKFFGGPHPAWTLTLGSVQDEIVETEVDRVILDMLAPWECLDAAAKALVPGGLICVMWRPPPRCRTSSRLRQQGDFAEPYAFETMLRSWHVEGLAVRRTAG